MLVNFDQNRLNWAFFSGELKSKKYYEVCYKMNDFSLTLYDLSKWIPKLCCMMGAHRGPSPQSSAIEMFCSTSHCKVL